MASLLPERLVLQWHITERCNLRCTHCYQSSFDSKEPDFEQLINSTLQYIELLKQWNLERYGHFVPGHINITGGEPFIRNDFIDFLEYLAKKANFFSFGILCNGSLIDEKIASKLKNLGVNFVQLSLEGGNETNDIIRGLGSYQKTIGAIKHLKKVGIRVYISFTASTQNYVEFSQVAKLGQKLKVDKVWTDRMVPFEGAQNQKNLLLQKDEFRNYLQVIKTAQSKKPFLSKTKIEMARALMFLKGGECIYRCKAGDSLLCLLHNGDVLVCRRLPLVAGNIHEKSLSEIYNQSTVMKNIRNVSFPVECDHCSYQKSCKGGAKCISYAMKNNYSVADPSCFVKKDEMY